jgi:3-hydroxyisobutyrate dehydrogenase
MGKGIGDGVSVVAMIGTGVMGAPMARNLAEAGFELRVWNRTADKARGLAGERIAAFDTVQEAVSGADAVITMLSDGAAVLEAVQEAVPSFGEATWIQASTVGIQATERLMNLAAEYGVTFVDVPVLGTKQPAERGQLTVLASGPEEAKQRCQGIFVAIGSKTVWLGAAGAGTRMKLVVNSWLVGLVTSLAASINLAQGIDVDPQQFLEVIDGSGINAPYAQLKGKAMVQGSLEPSFALSMARKDVGLVLEAAEQAGLEAHLALAVARIMDRAIEAGHGDEDLAAVYYGAR